MLIIFDLDDTLYDKTGLLGDNYSQEDVDKIIPFRGVKGFFQSFDGKSFLVTKEEEKGLQNKKINVLGIRGYFDLVMVCCSDQEKKENFKKIVEKYPQEEVLVVGDRIDSEIRYGNELNLKTILLKGGKYKDLKPKDDLEVPNHAIDEFAELNNLIK